MKHLHLLPTDKPSRLYLNGFQRLVLDNKIEIADDNSFTNQHIYITSDEEIKEGVDQWYLDKVLNEPYNSGGAQYSSKQDVIILTTDQDLIKDGVQAIDDEFLEWFVKNPSCEEVEVYREGYKKNGMIDEATSYQYKITIPKEEPKYPIGGYAPGNYTCYCSTCKIEFQGDKRACQCEPCAVSMTKEEPKQETLEEAAENYARKQCDDMYDDIAPSGGSWGWETSTDFIAGAKWQSERIENESEQLINELESLVKDNNLGESYRAGIMTSIWRIKKWFEQFKKK